MSGQDEIGDPVCWLDRLCPECRAVPTSADDPVCWRCGTALDRRERPADPRVE